MYIKVTFCYKSLGLLVKVLIIKMRTLGDFSGVDDLEWSNII